MEVIKRPKLARWMFDHGVKAPELATAIGVSAVQVRRYCLPFSDKQRQIPGEDVLARIVAVTAGKVSVPDFYPAELTAPAAAAELAPAAAP